MSKFEMGGFGTPKPKVDEPEETKPTTPQEETAKSGNNLNRIHKEAHEKYDADTDGILTQILDPIRQEWIDKNRHRLVGDTLSDAEVVEMHEYVDGISVHRITDEINARIRRCEEVIYNPQKTAADKERARTIKQKLERIQMKLTYSKKEQVVQPETEPRIEAIVKKLDQAAQEEVAYEFNNRKPGKVTAMALTPSYDALTDLYGSSEEVARRIVALIDAAETYTQEILAKDGNTHSPSWAWELGVKKAANEALTEDEKKAFIKAQDTEEKRQSRSFSKGMGMTVTPSIENMLSKLLSSAKDIK